MTDEDIFDEEERAFHYCPECEGMGVLECEDDITNEPGRIICTECKGQGYVPPVAEGELMPRAQTIMEDRCDRLCLDCLGDGWVYYPAYPAKATCEACKGTGERIDDLK